MHTNRLIMLFAIALIASAAAAQEDAPPVAEKMATFETHIGNWQGAGEVRPGPDMPTMSWTSTSTVKKILGGHFVMDQMKIEIEGVPVPMIYTSVSGWDSASERYVSFQVGNTGEAKESTVRFVGNKIISTAGGVENGAVIADHWVTVIDGDEMQSTGHRSVDGGPFFVHVEGSSKRGGPGFKIGPETADYAMAPPNEHMTPLAQLVGDWDFKGEWSPAAGVEPMALTGYEKTRSILGGHAIRSIGGGDGGGMTYESVGFMAWSPDDNSIVSVGLNNMGQYYKNQCWMVDGKLLTMHAGPYQGVPTASRGIMEISDDTYTFEGHTLSGTDDPRLSFSGEWTRTND